MRDYIEIKTDPRNGTQRVYLNGVQIEHCDIRQHDKWDISCVTITLLDPIVENVFSYTDETKIPVLRSIDLKRLLGLKSKKHRVGTKVENGIK